MRSARFVGVVATAPLWVPCVLLRGLLRICSDGLHFLWEAWRGHPLLVPAALEPVFALASIVLFPVAVTAETTFSFVLSLADLVLPSTTGLAKRLAFGALLALLAPVWSPLAGLAWMVRKLGAELVLPVARGGGARSQPGRGRFETFVALRYLRGRRAAGVSVVTGLTISGVAVGVWTLIVVLSVMAGFERDLQEKILGANSHVIIRTYWDAIEDWQTVAETARTVDGVAGVTPFLYTEFMLRSDKGATGAVLKGIDPASVGDATDLLKNLRQGADGRVDSIEEARAIVDGLGARANADDASDSAAEPGRPGLLLGRELAANLGVTIGDSVRGISPQGEPGPFGVRARVEEWEVAGIFQSGMYEYDTKFAYGTIEAVGRFLHTTGVTGLELRVRDIGAAPEIAQVLGAKLRYPLWTQDWQRMNEPLFAALKLEKVVMGVILTFIVAVASLNIISTLIMLVVEKGREIAILKAMGAGRFALLKLFMIDGLIVGFIGTVIGVVLGVATCAALARWQVIPLAQDVYYVDTLPVDLSLGVVSLVAALAVVIAFFATLYPAAKAGDLDPVEGLRDA